MEPTPSALDIAEARAITEARAIIGALVRAHQKSLRLARELMIAQEFADLQEARANRAIAVAASDPSDQEAIEHALRVSALSEEANEDEQSATTRWGEHVIGIHQLIAAVESLCWVERSPGSLAPRPGHRPASPRGEQG